MKPHARGPRCFDTMVQNIILPPICFAQEMDLETLWRGGHDVLKLHEEGHYVLIPREGGARCFDTMVQKNVLPQLGLAKEMDLKTL